MNHPTDQYFPIAEETGFPVDAVESMAHSIERGRGSMAQFDHPAFGGPGQWMQGGMLMISGPFDEALKQRVARLCALLAEAGVGDRDVAAGEAVASTWYPASLGVPSSSGAQNRTRYAWFAATRRLAVDDGAHVTIYDTGDHAIGGVSQQQGAQGSMRFTSQHGVLDLARLPVIDGPPVPDPPATPAAIDPFQALERLAALHARGIVDDDEFAAKRIALLERI